MSVRNPFHGRLIDLHCHAIPEHFPDNPSPAANSRWPCLTVTSAAAASLVIDGRPFRDVDARSWNMARRLEDMDRDGIQMQVLSPLPELVSYWFDENDALSMCDHVNGAIASMAEQSTARFRALGLVPLQHPALAVRYLPRIKGQFGLAGVEIGSNVNGVPIGDERFHDFYEAAEALDLRVFVHALHPVATKAIGADQAFTAMAGFPLDTGMAAASLILSGVPERFPKLRIAFSHGGGTLGSMLGRLDKGFALTRGYGGKLQRKPSEHAAALWYDSNVYDSAFLRHLATHMAPGRITLGTDYPYALMQTTPAAYLVASGLEGAALESLCFGAAEQFLAV